MHYLVLYQLSYVTHKVGTAGIEPTTRGFQDHRIRIAVRTANTILFFANLLYQLSYIPNIRTTRAVLFLTNLYAIIPFRIDCF